MTSFRVERVRIDAAYLDYWARSDPRFTNWPVVYALEGPGQIYVGESRNAAVRLRQHLDSPDKRTLTSARIVIDDTFNKSACLDLESYLIRLFAGDGELQVLNRNDGIVDSEYYDRARYQASFDAIFEELRSQGLFARSLREIENADLFKLSPFKALTQDQAAAVEDIVEGLFSDLENQRSSTIVIQGDPGTGKTVVAIYLMKLLMDIRDADPMHPVDGDSLFADFFVEGCPELLANFRVAIVVPQQSLRKSVSRVFAKTPGLHPEMVLSPFDVGASVEPFDLLIVDETHRLNQRANQSSGVRNKQFKEITERLFGEDDVSKTQLDWILAQSKHQIFLLDAQQSVRPSDLNRTTVEGLRTRAANAGQRYRLTSQLRVAAGEKYVSFMRQLLTDEPPEREDFPGYDLRLFDDIRALRSALAEREASDGLSRLLAGYAWEWRSRKDKAAFDIKVDGLQLRWNSTDVDWVNSPSAADEVGSIHTIQGYDLNYAGVIIGPDLRWDPQAKRMAFDRAQYFDKKGMENNPTLGVTYSDDDMLRFVRNIYAVLLTRGIKGTYIYVCDRPPAIDCARS